MMLSITLVLLVILWGFGGYFCYHAVKSKKGSEERELYMKECIAAFCFSLIALAMLPVSASLW